MPNGTMSNQTPHDQSNSGRPARHHSQAHSHSHSHSHHHAHGAILGRMKFAFILNLVFAVIELVGGIWTNSVAILSDALHDFGDAIAVMLAIVMEKLSHKQSDHHFSYGYRRFSTLGAIITGVVLIAGSVVILIEAIPRLMNPQQPETNGMIVLAVLGVAVNGLAAYRISHGTSLNEKMLMWHMIEDVMGWVLVLVGALVMKFFDVPQVDAGLAIALSLWILYNVFQNLKSAMKVFLMASPQGDTLQIVQSEILKINLVRDIHHAHLWSLDGENHVLTIHVVVDPTAGIAEMEKVKSEVKALVRNHGIIEATVETEVLGTVCIDPEHQ